MRAREKRARVSVRIREKLPMMTRGTMVEMKKEARSSRERCRGCGVGGKAGAIRNMQLSAKQRVQATV